mmetsp:Transcript_9258/g.18886  ORF Transcript_9258/g.18886 Transcript_9258/m.18886 type:complete len:101 (-) Transcript_9258:209-511(-)
MLIHRAALFALIPNHTAQPAESLYHPLSPDTSFEHPPAHSACPAHTTHTYAPHTAHIHILHMRCRKQSVIVTLAWHSAHTALYKPTAIGCTATQALYGGG